MIKVKDEVTALGKPPKTGASSCRRNSDPAADLFQVHLSLLLVPHTPRLVAFRFGISVV